jgi:uncharacterized membrane protein
MQQDPEEMHKDPSNWKWGLFYFNPQDKRTIVPKRNPFFGLTLNFASPYSVLLLIGTVVLVLLMIMIPKIIAG